MSCILEISGTVLDVDALLDACPLAPDRVWHAGERHALKGRVLNTSGVTFVASEADLDAFDLQVKETTRFLHENRDALAVAVSFAGVEYTGLRFGIGVFGEFAARTHELPAEFVKTAADAGLCVRLCHYRCSDQENSIP